MRTPLPSHTKHLILIGGRGVGKSTVADALFKKTGLRMLSTDELIVSRTGLSIPELVRQQGWSSFRLHEHAALEFALAQKTAIIDTGGGVVCDQDNAGKQSLNQENIQLMRDKGVVYWLFCPFEQQLNNVKTTSDRPPLTLGQVPEQELRETMAQRNPWYRKASNMSVPIDFANLGPALDTIWKHYVRATK